MVKKVVKCQTCKGSGEILKEVSPGRWDLVTCPARCRNGLVDKRLI